MSRSLVASPRYTNVNSRFSRRGEIIGFGIDFGDFGDFGEDAGADAAGAGDAWEAEGRKWVCGWGVWNWG